MNHGKIVIIGAGPAGLGAAYELTRHGRSPLVLEAGTVAGGIARTEIYKGYHFDIGGHRFITASESIQRLWRQLLGDDFLRVDRLSRIYYKDRYFDYPLKLAATLQKLGGVESARILLSYLYAQVFPVRDEAMFDQWICNRFGRRLYHSFFETYTEKVWGIPCSEIRADWAAQRIKGLSMAAAVANALLGTQSVKTLADTFFYPAKGPGMMWDRLTRVIRDGGGRIRMQAEAVGFQHTAGRITHVRFLCPRGTEKIPVDQLASSMPLASLVRGLEPAAPAEILAAAGRLAHRAMVMVGLILNRESLFPDQWVYVHSPEVKVGRIQNFTNWSAAMSPDRHRSHIGLEYFCNAGDALWQTPDAGLLELASGELQRLGLARAEDVIDGLVIRQPGAYPVYDRHYRQNLHTIRQYLKGFGNLHMMGRNGTHRYNNMDHAMAAGILAAQNIMGAGHDLWAVNTGTAYQEADAVMSETRKQSADITGRIFTHMNKIAFGTAVATVCGLLFFLSTLWLVVKGGPVVGPNMGLLGQYFPGYTVDVGGAVVGLVYGAVTGFCLGWIFAFLRNLILAIYLFQYKKTAEIDSIKDFFDHM